MDRDIEEKISGYLQGFYNYVADMEMAKKDEDEEITDAEIVGGVDAFIKEVSYYIISLLDKQEQEIRWEFHEYWKNEVAKERKKVAEEIQKSDINYDIGSMAFQSGMRRCKLEIGARCNEIIEQANKEIVNE